MEQIKAEAMAMTSVPNVKISLIANIKLFPSPFV
jgi:hypothetical protein